MPQSLAWTINKHLFPVCPPTADLLATGSLQSSATKSRFTERVACGFPDFRVQGARVRSVLRASCVGLRGKLELMHDGCESSSQTKPRQKLPARQESSPHPSCPSMHKDEAANSWRFRFMNSSCESGRVVRWGRTLEVL